MPERNLNFDEIVNRRGTDCLKYDFAVRRGSMEFSVTANPERSTLRQLPDGCEDTIIGRSVQNGSLKRRE